MIRDVIIPFGLWLWAAQALPHADVVWRALIPGAALFAGGVQALRQRGLDAACPLCHSERVCSGETMQGNPPFVTIEIVMFSLVLPFTPTPSSSVPPGLL